MGYEYLNSGQARACKRDLIRFSLNWFGTCKRGYNVRNVNEIFLLAKNKPTESEKQKINLVWPNVNDINLRFCLEEADDRGYLLLRDATIHTGQEAIELLELF